MIEIPFENVAFFDVDNTLIMYDIPPERSNEAIEISIRHGLPAIRVIPHEVHCELVRHHRAWGNGVVVWSRSGVEWASAVVKALGLEPYVDLVIAKPFYYYDDKKCCEILGEHRYKSEY